MARTGSRASGVGRNHGAVEPSKSRRSATFCASHAKVGRSQANFGRTRADFDSHRSKFGRIGPNLTKFGPRSTDIGVIFDRNGQSSARVWPNYIQSWPNSAGLGGQLRPSSTPWTGCRPDVGPMSAEFGAELAKFSRIRAKRRSIRPKSGGFPAEICRVLPPDLLGSNPHLRHPKGDPNTHRCPPGVEVRGPPQTCSHGPLSADAPRASNEQQPASAPEDALEAPGGVSIAGGKGEVACFRECAEIVCALHGSSTQRYAPCDFASWHLLAPW